MSVCTSPMLAEKTAVSAPTQATTSRPNGAISNSVWHRATM